MKKTSHWILILALALSGCSEKMSVYSMGPVYNVDDDLVASVGYLKITSNQKNLPVEILFVADTSASMTLKIASLKASLGTLLTTLKGMSIPYMIRFMTLDNYQSVLNCSSNYAESASIQTPTLFQMNIPGQGLVRAPWIRSFEPLSYATDCRAKSYPATGYDQTASLLTLQGILDQMKVGTVDQEAGINAAFDYLNYLFNGNSGAPAISESAKLHVILLSDEGNSDHAQTFAKNIPSFAAQANPSLGYGSGSSGFTTAMYYDNAFNYDLTVSPIVPPAQCAGAVDLYSKTVCRAPSYLTSTKLTGAGNTYACMGSMNPANVPLFTSSDYSAYQSCETYQSRCCSDYLGPDGTPGGTTCNTVTNGWAYPNAACTLLSSKHVWEKSQPSQFGAPYLTSCSAYSCSLAQTQAIKLKAAKVLEKQDCPAGMELATSTEFKLASAVCPSDLPSWTYPAEVYTKPSPALPTPGAEYTVRLSSSDDVPASTIVSRAATFYKTSTYQPTAATRVPSVGTAAPKMYMGTAENFRDLMARLHPKLSVTWHSIINPAIDSAAGPGLNGDYINLSGYTQGEVGDITNPVFDSIVGHIASNIEVSIDHLYKVKGLDTAVSVSVFHSDGRELQRNVDFTVSGDFLIFAKDKVARDETLKIVLYTR